MLDSRMRLAAVVLGSALTLLGSAQAHAAPTEMRYACEGGQNLVVQRDRSRAVVSFTNRNYELLRARSSIGDKYL